ncbi:hypothetical protein [Verminephrobacter eiseniae]|uniref:hypothetical protein n=1 Tax=Verminephrobacter eiseniae TaxID=364317 RepID=UPI00223738B3|nr:hypothetical protein [Verminephrobacter eiseniae]
MSKFCFDGISAIPVTLKMGDAGTAGTMPTYAGGDRRKPKMRTVLAYSLAKDASADDADVRQAKPTECADGSGME